MLDLENVPEACINSSVAVSWRSQLYVLSLNKSTGLTELMENWVRRNCYSCPRNGSVEACSVLRGRAANRRWLPFSVEQESSRNWSVATLSFFLHLLPYMPLKYRDMAVKDSTVIMTIFRKNWGIFLNSLRLLRFESHICLEKESHICP